MAIDTNTKKLAVMELDDDWEPGLPLSPGTFDQSELQQLLWGYPGILWQTAAALAFILDMNTRIFAYLCSFYSVDMATSDNTSLTRRYLDTQLTGEHTARFRQLMDDATP